MQNVRPSWFHSENTGYPRDHRASSASTAVKNATGPLRHKQSYRTLQPSPLVCEPADGLENRGYVMSAVPHNARVGGALPASSAGHQGRGQHAVHHRAPVERLHRIDRRESERHAEEGCSRDDAVERARLARLAVEPRVPAERLANGIRRRSPPAPAMREQSRADDARSRTRCSGKTFRRKELKRLAPPARSY